jgi:hypothetical protein
MQMNESASFCCDYPEPFLNCYYAFMIQALLEDKPDLGEAGTIHHRLAALDNPRRNVAVVLDNHRGMEGGHQYSAKFCINFIWPIWVLTLHFV